MFYGLGRCCPPNTPTPEETRRAVDSYKHAILLHIEAPASTNRDALIDKFVNTAVDLELKLFKEGYYKALALTAGPCLGCPDYLKACSRGKGNPRAHALRARPSMEACGIDVYQTVRNNGMFVVTLSEKTETQNKYCLVLVD